MTCNKIKSELIYEVNNISALFAYLNGLWICVMTHALMNTLSQITFHDNVIIGNTSKVICIVAAILLVHTTKKQLNES